MLRSLPNTFVLDRPTRSDGKPNRQIVLGYNLSLILVLWRCFLAVNLMEMRGM